MKSSSLLKSSLPHLRTTSVGRIGCSDSNHDANPGITLRVAAMSIADISLIESPLATVIQIVALLWFCAHSATSDDFPYPPGAITKVVPAVSLSMSGKRCLRER